jgi:hypothetical protein
MQIYHYRRSFAGRFATENAFWTERSNAYLKKCTRNWFVHLTEEDVVRHPVVKKIILAYNAEEKRQREE